MENNKSNNTRTGVGFAGLLTILFITLKLIGVITWSWIWVLSPLWIDIALVIIIVVILVLFTMVKDKKYNKKKNK